jgi:hypothetical protein
LKEKNMKRNLAVLVLLVTWSLLSISSLSTAAYAGELFEGQNPAHGSAKDQLVAETNGASGDDPEGDPGDAGDGYGIADQPELRGFMGVGPEVDKSILDEFLLILMSLTQLAL